MSDEKVGVASRGKLSRWWLLLLVVPVILLGWLVVSSWFQYQEDKKVVADKVASLEKENAELKKPKLPLEVIIYDKSLPPLKYKPKRHHVVSPAVKDATKTQLQPAVVVAEKMPAVEVKKIPEMKCDKPLIRQLLDDGSIACVQVAPQALQVVAGPAQQQSPCGPNGTYGIDANGPYCEYDAPSENDYSLVKPVLIVVGVIVGGKILHNMLAKSPTTAPVISGGAPILGAP